MLGARAAFLRGRGEAFAAVWEAAPDAMVLRERVDLAAIAWAVLDQAQHAAERTANHRLVLDSAGPVWHDADPGRLEQVVTNLVTNALKYSPDGGEVRCTVRRDDRRAWLSVSGQGLGIAPEAQGRLFQPFSRVASTARAIGGTGLGLYITRELVERHGGTIALGSAPGQGVVRPNRHTALGKILRNRPGSLLAQRPPARQLLASSLRERNTAERARRVPHDHDRHTKEGIMEFEIEYCTA